MSLLRKSRSVTLNPSPLLRRFRNRHSACCRDRIYCSSGTHPTLHQQARGDQPSASDSLAAMNQDVLSRLQVSSHIVQRFGKLRLGPRNLKIGNRKGGELQTLPLNLTSFLLQSKFKLLLSREQGKNRLNASPLPVRDVICEPIASARTGGQSHLSLPWPGEPIETRHSRSLTTT